eukprot:TRINITY_DN8232_c1_g1_i1.p1 TRINITY_DN8232_c1_g1~~TRINITY_DN8232_c1_g1_i1.p1  ORF type:complete len:995 (+),score=244.59 TRINITY_DN8232_c1_g1_i1:207-3191(+)
MSNTPENNTPLLNTGPNLLPANIGVQKLVRGVNNVGNILVGGVENIIVGNIVGAVEGVGTFAKKNIIDKIDFQKSRKKEFLDDEEDYAELKAQEEEMIRLNEEEVLKSLPPEYFVANYDSVTNMLIGLPSDVDSTYLNTLINTKDDVLNIVNQRLFNKVMGSYNEFVQGMAQIHELGLDLQQSMEMCRGARKTVNHLQHSLAFGALSILGNFKRRQIWSQILNDLQALRELTLVEERLRKLLQEGSYPEVVQTYLDSRDTAQYTKSLFKSALDIENSLQILHQNVQDKLDNALYEICREWNEQLYEKILSAQKLLKKKDTFIQRLQPIFENQIEIETKNILLAHALMLISGEDAPKRAEKMKTMKFTDLCLQIKDEVFTPCLLTVLEYLVSLMMSHYEMTCYHRSHPDEEFTYSITSFLQKFKVTMWDHIQRQVSVMLGAVNLTPFKIEDFLSILDGILQFLEIGEAFGGSVAHNLRGTVRVQSKNYFTTFHQSRIEDLVTMLENEIWGKIPVPANFTFNDVKEFHQALLLLDSARTNATKSLILQTTEKSNYEEVFSNLHHSGNPFNALIQYKGQKNKKNIQKNSGSESDDDEPPELYADTIDEDDEPQPKKKQVPTDEVRGGPILANTTINLLRNLARYFHMMKTLQAISHEVFVGITQMVEFYIFTIFSFFGGSPYSSFMLIEETMTPKMKYVLDRLKKKILPPKDNILGDVVGTPQKSQPSQEEVVKVKWKPARLPQILDINTNKNFFGLPIRMIGIESTRIIEDALKDSQTRLQAMLPSNILESHFNTFFNDTLGIVDELREYMYKGLAFSIIETEKILKAIDNVKWDTLSLPAQNSPYVDFLLKMFQFLVARFDEMDRATGCFTPKSRTSLLFYMVARSMDTLLEGYTRIKKCSAMGRAAMQRDLKEIQIGLEQITGIKPIPGQTHVENYITAYYEITPDTDIISWAKEHPDFNKKQITNLVNMVLDKQIKKKQKGALLDLPKILKTK